MEQSELSEILENHKRWLKNNEEGSRADLSGADLRGADLSEADLRGAEIDFSCLPLMCGGLGWKIDAKIARQLAYHFCSMVCDDKEFMDARAALLTFANKFHRAQECGELR
jgi:uncharacterized protein YjbI with pentapeptide repeats